MDRDIEILILTGPGTNIKQSKYWYKTQIKHEEIYIEDIYFFEVNTKYISSNVLKISVISQVHSTSDIADIFNT